MARFFRYLSILFGLLFLVPIVLVAWSLFKSERVPRGTVLHLQTEGALAESPRPSLMALVGGRGHLTLRAASQAIVRAGRDERIVGLVLDVRGSGYGLAQLAELRAALEDFKKSGKWNVAFLQSAGEFGSGDGAYALASAASQVILSPPGDIDLTGLRADLPFLKTTLQRAQVGVWAGKRHEYKNYPNMFTEDGLTPAHRESLVAVLDDLQATVLAMVAESRGVDMARARAWVEGAPYSAAEALDNKLVDRLAYWDEVRRLAIEKSGRDDPFVDLETYAAQGGRSRGKTVALVVASGSIHMGESSHRPDKEDSIGSDTLAQAFVDARHDHVDAVLFRIDSGGGSYVASDLIRREVELTRQAGIPVAVSLGNTAASGGYFIALAGDRLFAQPGTITGSIGVFAASFAVRQALDHWLGVKIESYSTLPHAGTLNGLDLPDAADQERLGKALDRIYRDFVTKVAEARHKTYDEVHALARGRIWTGRQAVQNGLADELGGMDTALAYLRGRLNLQADEPLRLAYYPTPDTPLEVLRQALGGASVAQSSVPPSLRTLWQVVQRSPKEQVLALPPELGAALTGL